MKTRLNVIACLLALCLLAALCGCGAADSQSSKPTPAAPTPAPTAQPAAPADPTAAPATTPPTETPSEPPAETEAPAAPVNEALETAKTFVGKTTPDLFAAIGMPDSSDYAPSCLGPGEDGNLYYDGFTVYTYRENGVETIRIVE